MVYTCSKFGVPHSSYFYPSLSRCCHKSLLISFSIRYMPWCLCVSVNGLWELKELPTGSRSLPVTLSLPLAPTLSLPQKVGLLGPVGMLHTRIWQQDDNFVLPTA